MTEQNQAAELAVDDTEGHIVRGDDEDTEGHVVRGDDEDTEGHVVR